MIISKEIAEKIRKVNELNYEICIFIAENFDDDMFEEEFNNRFWNIVPEPQGIEKAEGEFCDSEDWAKGEYYWKLEGESNYLCCYFEI